MNDSIFSAEDRESVRNRYSKRFSEHGHSEKSLGWGEKGRQQLRYHILSNYWNLTDKTVLDIGAGFGDFFPVARDKGIKKYIGLEFMKDFVLKGQELYGDNPDFSILEHDISSSPDLPANDVTLISGLFNFKLVTGENYAFIEDVLQRSFEKCTVGVSANFVTNRVDFCDPVMFYADPSKIISIALNLSRKVSLVHDYFPFEYTLHISKDDSFDKKTSVFCRPVK